MNKDLVPDIASDSTLERYANERSECLFVDNDAPNASWENTFEDVAPRQTLLQRCLSAVEESGLVSLLAPNIEDVPWCISNDEVWRELNYGRD